VYRARDHVENERWLAELQQVADRLGLETAARSRATDLYLSTVTEWDDDADGASKRAVLAASLYAGSLIEGDQRSQSAVADAAGVSRLTVQQRWKELLERAGLEPPSW